MNPLAQLWQDISLWGMVLDLGVVSIGAALWWQILTRPRAQVRAPAARQLPECTCSHPEFAHQHYRPGSDCGECGCSAYVPYRDTPARHA